MGCVGIEVPAVDDAELGEFFFGGRRVARGTAGERDGDAVVVRGLVVVVVVVVMIVSVSVSVSVSVADLSAASLVGGCNSASSATYSLLVYSTHFYCVARVAATYVAQ